VKEWVRLGVQVNPLEVDRAKNKLKSVFLSQLDGTQSICHDIGMNLLQFNRRVPPAEVFARINEIDSGVIQAAAKRYCHDTEPAVVVMGDVGFVDYNTIRSWTNPMFL